MPALTASKLQLPVLADKVLAETMVAFLFDEHEPGLLLDFAGGGQHVVGP
jgi:hypothetical protein